MMKGPPREWSVNRRHARRMALWVLWGCSDGFLPQAAILTPRTILTTQHCSEDPSLDKVAIQQVNWRNV